MRDTIALLHHNKHLTVICITQMVAMLGYNITGMHVTGHLGSVFRTVLETMRTLFVWLAGLAIFYLGTGLGERWDQYSLVQARKFVLLSWFPAVAVPLL